MDRTITRRRRLTSLLILQNMYLQQRQHLVPPLLVMWAHCNLNLARNIKLHNMCTSLLLMIHHLMQTIHHQLNHGLIMPPHQIPHHPHRDLHLVTIEQLRGRSITNLPSHFLRPIPKSQLIRMLRIRRSMVMVIYSAAHLLGLAGIRVLVLGLEGILGVEGTPMQIMPAKLK